MEVRGVLSREAVRALLLLRTASRARGAWVTELAQDVAASTANPLLRLPDEPNRALPEPRQRTRSLRRSGGRNAASS